jgi:ring-1,2-phenylacetyl-CoA epoxidase subunit PaaC
VIATVDTETRFVLRLGDTCLILAQRLAEWCGHGPILEEDIALANVALDLLEQSRRLLDLAGRSAGLGEDALAFLRDAPDFLNPTIVELPHGIDGGLDFGFTVVRNLLMTTWLGLVWEALVDDGDSDLAAIARGAASEAEYHQRHSAGWFVRLADGTAESRSRIERALSVLWPTTSALFTDDDDHQSPQLWSQLAELWRAQLMPVFRAAGLPMPVAALPQTGDRWGTHTAHLPTLLDEMQYMQRTYPGGTW